MIRGQQNELIPARSGGDVLPEFHGGSIETFRRDADLEIGAHRLLARIVQITAHLDRRILSGLPIDIHEPGGIAHGHRAGGFQPDMLPDAHVPITHARRPIPADGLVHGHVVENRSVAAVGSDAAVDAAYLLLHRIAGHVQLMDANGQRIRCAARLRKLANIESKPLEHPHHVLRIGDLMAVQPNIRAIVDPIEMQPHRLALITGGQRERSAEPVRAIKRIRVIRQVTVLASDRTACSRPRSRPGFSSCSFP